MTKRTVQFKIYRYDPDKDDKPYMQDISVELEAADKKLLDAITRLKVKDDTLSFRRSCREGVCGSDAMNINGKNGLACLTDVDSLEQPITLRPLPGLPVIRDLIVDMTQFFKQYHSITPYLINNEPAPSASACRPRRSVKNSTGFTSASSAPAVRLPARRSGGTPTSSWDRPVFWPPIGSSPIRVTRQPRSASTTSRTRIACSAATPS